MKKLTLILPLAVLLLWVFSCSPEATPEPPANPLENVSLGKLESIKKGEYLATVMDCGSCHTPKLITDKGPVPDMKRLLSGYPSADPLPEIRKSEVEPGKWILFHGDLTATVGPWGVSFGANLTPDVTGLGEWTFENFKMAMTQGRHKGQENGRELLPPMPWQAYSMMTEVDLKALFDYLQSIPPVSNIVPAPIPPDKI